MLQQGWIFILFSVAFLYLFVCVDERGTGYLAKMKIFFWQTVPNTLRAIGKKVCGAKFVWLIDRIAHYICYENNPFVQIIYFACAFGGFYVYVRDGFPLIPNTRVDFYHIPCGTVLMFMCYASYFMACWVNPGQIDKNSDRG